MIALKLDYDTHEEFPDLPLHDGQDVTGLFETQIARPVGATVIQAVGPGGGNPYIKFTFVDDDHAWEWFSCNYADDADQFCDLMESPHAEM
jgi:hypothetical protein